MARDTAEADDERRVLSDCSDGTSGNTSLLGRRGYLKLAGAATATAAFGTGAASATDYEVIEVGANEHWTYALSDGETFENYLIDITARGASATINARGPTNWTIRNVAFRGPMSGAHRAIGCSDEGNGHSRIENVYIGDGTDDNSASHWSDPSLGIWVAPAHNGEITFDRVYIEGANDNGFYASAPGSNGNGAGGLCHFENCYAKDNWVANFRTAGGEIRNCVSVATEDVWNPRPLWVWEARHTDGVEVYDSHFIRGPFAFSIRANDSNAKLHLEDTQYEGPMNNVNGATVTETNTGNDPRDFVPEGCPDSVEAVFESTDASAGSGSFGDENSHTLELGGQFAYRVEVDGSIEPAPAHAKWLTEGDDYGDDWAEWWLSGNADAHTEWRFTGELTDLAIDEYDGETDVRYVRVDGEEIDYDEFVSGESDEHTLELGGQFAYRVEVDGTIEPAPAHAEWLTEGDDYGDDWAEWWLSGSADAHTEWRFTGELDAIEIDDHDGETDVRYVRVDGEEIDLEDFRGGEGQLLLIQGSDDGVSRYEFVVDGSVEPSTAEGATIDDGLEIDGSSVSGSVANWRDAFIVDGDLVEFTINGPATVTLDGEALDPESVGN